MLRPLIPALLVAAILTGCSAEQLRETRQGPVVAPPTPLPLDLLLPEYTHGRPPSVAVNIVAKKSALLVDGVQVLQLSSTDPAIPNSARRGLLVLPLFYQLKEAVDRQESLRKRVPTRGPLHALVQIHKEHPAELLISILYTAGQAGFAQYQLVGLDPDGAPTVHQLRLPRIGLDRDVLAASLSITTAGIGFAFLDQGEPTSIEFSCPNSGCQAASDWPWAALRQHLPRLQPYAGRVSISLSAQPDLAVEVLATGLDTLYGNAPNSDLLDVVLTRQER